MEIPEAERVDIVFHEALPVLQLREKTRPGQAVAGPLEAGADLLAPRLGKLLHEPADARRFDLGNRDELAAACAAALPARDDPPFRAGPFHGEVDEAVRDPLEYGQERLQPRRFRGESHLHLDLVVPDLHSDADVHMGHEMPTSPLERVAPAPAGSKKNLPGPPGGLPIRPKIPGTMPSWIPGYLLLEGPEQTGLPLRYRAVRETDGVAAWIRVDGFDASSSRAAQAVSTIYAATAGFDHPLLP
ncbi:MAG TPA: hypothetical protein VF580_15045, partial [Thermoanaerobaculia bacterium]